MSEALLAILLDVVGGIAKAIYDIVRSAKMTEEQKIAAIEALRPTLADVRRRVDEVEL